MGDVWLYRMVVCFLGVSALLCLAGSAWIESQGNPAPQGLLGIAGTCVGAIAALLVQIPKEPPRPDA